MLITQRANMSINLTSGFIFQFNSDICLQSANSTNVANIYEINVRDAMVQISTLERRGARAVIITCVDCSYPCSVLFGITMLGKKCHRLLSLKAGPMTASVVSGASDVLNLPVWCPPLMNLGRHTHIP